VEAIGVTLSHEQAIAATKRVADAGLADRVEIREQDYRDVDDGPYDAISSIGMFEHVGAEQLGRYFGTLRELVRPGGRLLNHGISRPRKRRPRVGDRSFIGRYVFPDGELCEVGTVVSAMQNAEFEARHLESLREHYGRTLRHWVANLEAGWDEAVAESSIGRARVWRLYMAASAVNFEQGGISVHQLLGVRPYSDGRSGLALRPAY
jgi:cyclopropane-fatty-acyl-phospholipid synthase